MRIAYFTDTPRIGGAERFLADVVAGAEVAGHEVTIISPQSFLLEFVAEASPRSRVVQAGRVDYFTAPSRGRVIKELVWAVPELRRTFARARVDLLHVNNGGYPGSDLCRLATIAGRLAGVPARLLTVHSAPWARETSQPQLQAIVDRLVWGSVGAVHATSAFVNAGLRDLRGMPPSLGRHIPYGVVAPAALSEATARLRSRLSPRGTRLLVGMVSATADPGKGHFVFVEALAQAGPDVHAVIVGPHPGDPFVERIRHLGLGGRVSLEGPVASAAVGTYLRAVDLLVVPSTAYESLPFVVLEAMASGRPVFASRLSGIPEAVVDGETGRLFEPGAVPDLGALLGDAARGGYELARMGEAGRERWQARFSIGAMNASLLELYDQLFHARLR
jgi:glycosyltransferase involved in cell wall biosynthesis